MQKGKYKNKLVNVFDKKSIQIRQDVTIFVSDLFFKLTNEIKPKKISME